MSDVSDTVDTPQGLDFSGISLDDEFTQGDKIGKRELVRALLRRIPGRQRRLMEQAVRNTGQGYVGNPMAGFADLLTKLVEDLPEEYHTKNFAEFADIRPLLSQAAQQAEEGGRYSTRDRALAAAAIPTMTQVISDQLREAFPSDDPEQQATLDALLDEWRGGSVKSLNMGVQTVTDEEGNVQVIGTDEDSLADRFLNFDVDTGTARPTVLSEEEWRRLLRSGQEDFGSLLTQEEMMRAGGGYAVDPGSGAQYRIDNLQVRYDTQVDKDALPMPGDQGAASEAAIARKTREAQNWYGLSEIMQKPYEMSKEEAVALHRKMERAGIFEIVGAEPLVPGDPNDPAFQRAWRHLAQASMAENKSMMTLLEERTQEYQDAVNASLAVQLTDPARIKLNSNAMARNTIGRHLNDEEHAQLLQFVHDLERKNARMAAGLEETSNPDVDYDDVEGSSEETMYDIDAQIDQWFDENLGAEDEAHQLADTYTMFTSMLGGPGRGVR